MVVKKVPSAAGEYFFFILPPRASRTFKFFILPPRASPDENRFRKKSHMGPAKFFTGKTGRFSSLFFRMNKLAFMIFVSEIKTTYQFGAKKPNACPRSNIEDPYSHAV